MVGNSDDNGWENYDGDDDANDNDDYDNDDFSSRGGDISEPFMAASSGKAVARLSCVGGLSSPSSNKLQNDEEDNDDGDDNHGTSQTVSSTT